MDGRGLTVRLFVAMLERRGSGAAGSERAGVRRGGSPIALGDAGDTTWRYPREREALGIASTFASAFHEHR